MTMIDADISISVQKNVTVVAISGELDDFQAPKLHSAMQTIDSPGVGIIIDLTHVTFVDSIGLGVIVSQAKGAKKQGVPFGLVAIAPQVMRLIDQSGITKSKQLGFSVYPTLDEGILGIG
jgi:anti-sigma B factor antagonist